MNGKEAIFEEITAENFLKLIKGIKPHTENLYEPKPHKYKTSEQKTSIIKKAELLVSNK